MEFIARYIHSVEQLEILCLLVEHPDRSWRDSEVFKDIQSSLESVSKTLQYFSGERLLAIDSIGAYRFPGDNEILSRLTRELVDIYRQKRVTVVEAIYTMPADPIRNFADAFRIKKEKP